MAKSKYFRVAVEGATCDKREIKREWLEQAAKNYGQDNYGARVNLEHIRGLTPDSYFRMFGDVLALEAREIKGGKLDGKLGLYAQIDPTDELIAMNKARQKVYTSIEIDPNFADSGEAYLVGLAVTDSPASLGTEMLQFAANAEENPFDNRKRNPNNIITEAIEFTLELEEESTGLIEGFAAKIKGMVSAFKKTSDTNFTEMQDAITVIAESQQTLLEKYGQLEADSAAAKAFKTELDKLSAEYAELVQKLSKEPEGQRRDRTPGGTGAIKTDC